MKNLIKKILSEDNTPQPGVSSAKGTDVSNMKSNTKYLNINEILSQVEGIPYYKEVLSDILKNDYSWPVTKKVLEYAQYLKSNPKSVVNFPPINVINDKLDDGAHRISAIYLLDNLLDRNNPYWDDVKIRVDFYDKILSEEFEKVQDYKKEMSTSHKEYLKFKEEITPLITKYLDSLINIEMIVKSNDNPTTYTVYFYDVEPISKHYCYGCGGTFHYPTGNHDLYTSNHYEDNDQFTSAVEMAVIDMFGGDLSDMEFYSLIYEYLFDRIKRYMDNDPINDYPEEHDMDW